MEFELTEIEALEILDDEETEVALYPCSYTCGYTCRVTFQPA
ncbi:hypothetical protein Afil01_35200 [Actinorhabdospora filicis]|uniref:Uncharacterized protein n=1 Tax=Actinorhabdospora filicis TaxID=1785913 RepID=A0A9W6WA66_9ACTN|nr:hypothetical protein [Actinorhabdospora filicis]GLZ78713.1 hypothetical protein Afil01_35200 [Actinorhabdospora filicis]